MAITQEDAKNLIALLNRVSVTGVQEAQIYMMLVEKLTALATDHAGGLSFEGEESK